MKPIPWNLIYQLQSNVYEDVWSQPVLQDTLKSEVLLLLSVILVVLIDHDHADDDVPKGEQTLGQDC